MRVRYQAFDAHMQRVMRLAVLQLGAELERAYGNVGRQTVRWFRVRPHLATPRGKLP